MKLAKQWQEELGSITLNQRVTAASIKRIQADALRWALAQVVPDGNPEITKDKIETKLNELEQ